MSQTPDTPTSQDTGPNDDGAPAAGSPNAADGAAGQMDEALDIEATSGPANAMEKALYARDNPGGFYFRWLFLPVTVGLLCFAILFAMAWFASIPQNSNINEDIIAPGSPQQDEFDALIVDPTEAELKRIAQLGLVYKPYPHSMPVEVQESRIAVGDVAARGRDFAEFLRDFTNTECVDGVGQVNVRANINATRLTDLQRKLDNEIYLGKGGILSMRKHYHKALIELCRGRFEPAAISFRRIGKVAEEDNVQGPFADQFVFLGAVGERLALTQLPSSSAKFLPDLPEMPVMLGKGPDNLCGRPLPGEPCSHFYWPEIRTDMSIAHEFLALPEADAKDPKYSDAIGRLYNGESSLTAYNYASLVAAEAKAGERDRVQSLVQNVFNKGGAFKGANTCGARDRIAILGAIYGLDEDSVDGCSRSFPYPDGQVDGDADRVDSFKAVVAARNSLIAGNLVQFDEQLAKSAGLRDDTTAFHDAVRVELRDRYASFLGERLKEAKVDNDQEAIQAVKSLLKSGAFPFSVRWNTLTSEIFGFSGWFWLTLWVLAVLVFMVIAVIRRNLFIGYALAFPQRYHEERVRRHLEAAGS